VWNTHHGRDATLKAFDDSMERLGLEWLDVYLMHWPSQAQDRYVETWEAMRQLRDEGRVGRIGVCNFAIPQLDRLQVETGELPFLNQVELHPFFQQRPLRDYHARTGILTQSWSPLGIWKDKASPLDNTVVRRVAIKYGRTPGQIILRWHLEEGLHLLTKSERVERIRENFEVLDFELDNEDLIALRKLDRADGRNGPDPETATF
ncbi:MAG: aldo/keto reductase, partial [Oceanococcus sp.]